MTEESKTSVGQIKSLRFDYLKFKEELALQGERYPDGFQEIPWAEFVLKQFSYWPSLAPFSCPNFIRLTSPDCDEGFQRINEMAQITLDCHLWPYDFMREIPYVCEIGEKVRARRRISSTDVGALEINGGDIKLLLLGLREVRQRPFLAAYTKPTGVIHNGLGFVQLVTRREVDVEKLVAQLAAPSWLAEPQGRFIREKGFAPVEVVLDASLPVPFIGHRESKTILGGKIPVLLSAGPDCERSWSTSEEEHYLKTSQIVRAHVQAARIQKDCPRELGATSVHKIQWLGESSRHSSELRVRFWRTFGSLNHLTDGHRTFLVESWCSCHRFAERFCQV